MDGLDDRIAAASAYDSKPAHFLSSSCKEISWAKKTKKVWAQDQECAKDLEFLLLSSADNCNNGMGDVSIAD